MILIYQTWIEWQPRFQYWLAFREKNGMGVSISFDWWRSRFNDDHPTNTANGWSRENYEKQRQFGKIWDTYMLDVVIELADEGRGWLTVDGFRKSAQMSFL